MTAVTGSAAVKGSAAVEAEPPAAREGAEAHDGSLPFAHAAHAKGGQMGGGPPGVARGG